MKKEETTVSNLKIIIEYLKEYNGKHNPKDVTYGYYDVQLLMDLARHDCQRKVQNIIDKMPQLDISRVSKMITENSKETWIAAKGSKDGWKEWNAERNKLNLNTVSKP